MHCEKESGTRQYAGMTMPAMAAGPQGEGDGDTTAALLRAGAAHVSARRTSACTHKELQPRRRQKFMI